MKKIQIHKWIIEYDYNKTKEFYKNFHLITDGCDCLNCKNFVEAIPVLPKGVITFFESLGIDPRKEGEVSEYCENEDGTHLYGGFFHLVGRLISGPDVWNKNDESGTMKSLDKDLYKIENFKFGFTNEINLARDGFPEPVLQIEFEAIVPWVISEQSGKFIEHHIHASEPGSSSVREKQSAGKQNQQIHLHRLSVSHPVAFAALSRQDVHTNVR